MEPNEPCFQDRVVHDVLTMTLEPVFEAWFSFKSHGFRPGRDARTVIRTIRSNYAGYLWFLKGDLLDIFQNGNRDLVLQCLEKRVKDRKVLTLVKLGLKSTIGSRMWPEEHKSSCKNRRKRMKKKFLNDYEPKPDCYWLSKFYEEAAKVPNYGCCGILSPLLDLSELDYMMEAVIIQFF